MVNLKEYLKYYFLENYLFINVSKNFRERKHLTSEEFFAIVIWKSSRTKTKIQRSIIESKKTIHLITSEIFHAKTPEQKLEMLKKIRNIGIPIASAILTVCYPDDFTIVDRRSRTALKGLGEEINGDPTVKISAYFEYLKKCKELARKHNLSLRNFDRVLWTKDWYEGEKGLKDLANGTE